ncbi:MAG: hypothetical protein Q7U54_17940 [Bacteroidales bacterium]|nr:hypothetical protein [Bacteroidales bacterium]
MIKILILIMASLISIFSQLTAQNTDINKHSDNKGIQLTVPETSTEFSISSYKNVNLQKISPLQLKASGLHTEIYISNTNQGVIIISSAEANKALKDFSHTLELNPTFYETLTRQDTTIVFSKNTKNPTFDFTRASSINHDYKNAFNYTVDPRTGVSWSKGNYDELNLKPGMGYGQLLYDIIIWLPKAIK